MRHLQEELDMKSDTIRKQQIEISELRQMIIDLQTENARLKTTQEFNKEN